MAFASFRAELPRTLSRFFQDVDKILLVRMSYERLSTWKRLQWDPTSHGEAFAHLYATALTGDMVDVDVSEHLCAWFASFHAQPFACSDTGRAVCGSTGD